jgi:transcriptional regulator with XRE-family HTH domain
MSGEEIRRKIVIEYKEKHGMTIKQLAEKSGLHPKTVSRFLKGEKSTSWDTMYEIFRAIQRDIPREQFWEFVISDDLLRRLVASFLANPPYF